MKLVIVESPNKVKKIAGFLGAGFTVKASFGHVRDLPDVGGLAIRFDNGRVTPQYETRARGGLVTELKALANQADEILLATDPDREGEAISWHLQQILGPRHRYRRVRFHEITESAIQKAVANPTEIDQHLVDAQQARRVVDRVVGWLVSPTCKSAVVDGQVARSAGRVQSVALRLVVDREREITNFAPQTFYVLQAQLQKPGLTPVFWARLIKWGSTDIPKGLRKPEDADKLAAACRDSEWRILRAETRQAERSAPPSFTTASMQQAASNKLGLDPEQTMALAQALFEAGLISYMRTDSTTLSPEAIAAARAHIADKFGQSYLPSQPNLHTSKSANTQEAHEAIRPTHLGDGREAAYALGEQCGKLYDLIEGRTVASQMAARVVSVTTIDVSAAGGRAVFRVTGNVPVFDGWKRLMDDDTEEKGDDKEEAITLPPLADGDPLTCLDFRTDRSKTKPPPRYTQASLVKKLESDGIGRPSTFASTLKTLFKRVYIKEEARKLAATPLGCACVDFLVKAYSGNFIEYAYTAKMEEDLDRISRGEEPWQQLLTKVSFALLPVAQAAGLSYNPLIGEEPARAAPREIPKDTPAKPCKNCAMKIHWVKDGERSLPCNADGTRHQCQTGRGSPKGSVRR